MKRLILYILHELTDNVKFFLKYGIYQSPDDDFLIIINHPSLSVPYPPYDNVRIHHRQNVGYDFGGWSAGIFLDDNYQKYDYYLFINSSVRGPFLPSWYRENWVDLFTRLITADVKLGGTSIGMHFGQPHIQSVVLVTDRVGLEIGIEHNIFIRDFPLIGKMYVIHDYEIKYSQVILKKGYNIACLLREYQGWDFRLPHPSSSPHSCPYNTNSNYYYVPYQVIFVKYTGKKYETPQEISKLMAFYPL